MGNSKSLKIDWLHFIRDNNFRNRSSKLLEKNKNKTYLVRQYGIMRVVMILEVVLYVVVMMMIVVPVILSRVHLRLLVRYRQQRMQLLVVVLVG